MMPYIIILQVKTFCQPTANRRQKPVGGGGGEGGQCVRQSRLLWIVYNYTKSQKKGKKFRQPTANRLAQQGKNL